MWGERQQADVFSSGATEAAFCTGCPEGPRDDSPRRRRESRAGGKGRRGSGSEGPGRERPLRRLSLAAEPRARGGGQGPCRNPGEVWRLQPAEEVTGGRVPDVLKVEPRGQTRGLAVGCAAPWFGALAPGRQQSACAETGHGQELAQRGTRSWVFNALSWREPSGGDGGLPGGCVSPVQERGLDQRCNRKSSVFL